MNYYTNMAGPQVQGKGGKEQGGAPDAVGVERQLPRVRHGRPKPGVIIVQPTVRRAAPQ
jgi:hypothetical protein